MRNSLRRSSPDWHGEGLLLLHRTAKPHHFAISSTYSWAITLWYEPGYDKMVLGLVFEENLGMSQNGGSTHGTQKLVDR